MPDENTGDDSNNSAGLPPTDDTNTLSGQQTTSAASKASPDESNRTDASNPVVQPVTGALSVSFQGIRVNFDVQWINMFRTIFGWLKAMLYDKNDQRPPQEIPTTVAVSHTPRRFAFFIVGLVAAVILVNLAYSSTASTCIWQAHAEALSELQTTRIVSLLNGTMRSPVRVTELVSAKISILELRPLVKEKTDDGSEASLDTVMEQYAEDVSIAVSKLLRVDASIAALVHITIAQNVAAFEHLEMSSRVKWWLSLFCWGSCRDPTFEAFYLGMLHAEDAVIHALEASLYEIGALRESVKNIQSDASRLHHHTKVRRLVQSSSGAHNFVDPLPLLWDAAASIRIPAAMKADRRRSLAEARLSLQKVLKYTLSTQEDMLNLMKEMRLLKFALRGRGITGMAWAWLLGSDEQETCSLHAGQGVRAFNSLIHAANELRAMLAKRL